jgi:hypothetical protein
VYLHSTLQLQRLQGIRQSIHYKDVEKIRPSAIIDIIHSGKQLNVSVKVKSWLPSQGTCTEVDNGYLSSQEVCMLGLPHAHRPQQGSSTVGSEKILQAPKASAQPILKDSSSSASSLSSSLSNFRTDCYCCSVKPNRPANRLSPTRSAQVGIVPSPPARPLPPPPPLVLGYLIYRDQIQL